MLPLSAIIFLSLLCVVVIILGTVNLMFGKGCICCRKKDEKDGSDNDSSDDDDETKSLLELEEKKYHSGSSTSDVRIKIYGKKMKVKKTQSYPTHDELINDKNFEVGPVYNKPFVRAIPNTIVRTSSVPNRPQNLYYGAIDNNHHSSTESVGKTISSSFDSNKDSTTQIFNGVESISIQVLVTFDGASRTLSSGVKQIEIGRNNIHNTVNSRKTNSSKLFWQVVIEVIDKKKSEMLTNQRIKTKYKSIDDTNIKKIHFQRNLETENVDCKHLDNYLVRYSIFARRGTRVSHKQLFGQTNVFLTTLREQSILFEWRAIPSPGTNILEFNNDERLI